MEPTDHSLRLPRSPDWPALRNKWLAQHPTCAACGASNNLQVHHKVPVHVNRSLELTAANLITLCENNADPKKQHCHLEIGHSGNWFNYNKNVEIDARKINLALFSDPLKPHFGIVHHEKAQADLPPDQAPTESASLNASDPLSPAELLKTAPLAHPAAAAPGDSGADKPKPNRHWFRRR